MNKLYVALLAGIMGASGATVYASEVDNTTGYIGLSYGVLKQQNKFFEGKGSTETDKLFVRLGGDLNEYFSSELRLGFTVDNKEGKSAYAFDDVSKGEKIKFTHEFMVSGLLRAGLPLGSLIKPYVLVGYTLERERLSYSGGSKNGNIHDISYGAGIDLRVSKHVVLNGEWIQYDDKSGSRLKGPSFGIAARF